MNDSFFSATGTAMAGSHSYQTIYGSVLLDDIHNYFPQLLYRSDRFRTLPQVFAYVHRQIDVNFNLGARGRRFYMDSELQAPATYFIPTPMVVPPAMPNQSVRVDLDVEPLTSLAELSALLPLIQRFIGSGTTNQMRPRQEDVVVHASNEVIQRASTERTLEQDSEEFCAICQDEMHAGELVRQLTVCHHEFHRSCIDNWLLNRSVHCPTCRFDVRETGRTSSTVRSPLLAPATASAGSTGPAFSLGSTGPAFSLGSTVPATSGTGPAGPTFPQMIRPPSAPSTTPR
jgi:hypothetical protein